MLLRLHLPLPLGTGRTALLDGGIFARRRLWKKLTDFTVPDNGNWGNMQLEQLSGDKNVWMQVPTEILGQSVAWIRLRPVQNKIGTATTYDTATIASNGQVANAFTVSYAALRYNK